ncbi:MAG: hypothetical protein ABIG40_02485 [Parcubacteria group bacterium]
MNIKKFLVGWGASWFLLALVHGFLMSSRIPELTSFEKSAHSHLLCLATTCILVGLAQPMVKLSNKFQDISAWLLASGTVVLPIGILLQITGSAALTAIPIIGAISFILGFLGFLVGILKA